MDEFYSLVKAATPEQRANLSAIMGSAFGDSPETLVNHIKYLRGGTLGQLLWDKSWKQVVTDVADYVVTVPKSAVSPLRSDEILSVRSLASASGQRTNTNHFLR